MHEVERQAEVDRDEPRHEGAPRARSSSLSQFQSLVLALQASAGNTAVGRELGRLDAAIDRVPRAPEERLDGRPRLAQSSPPVSAPAQSTATGWLSRTNGEGEEDSGERSRQSKPRDAPRGTRPIDQSGLDKDDVHEIKDGVGAGPRDWVGITPDGHVITSDEEGNAVDHGHFGDYLPRVSETSTGRRLGAAATGGLIGAGIGAILGGVIGGVAGAGGGTLVAPGVGTVAGGAGGALAGAEAGAWAGAAAGTAVGAVIGWIVGG
jgi:hypothetical protein